MRGLWLILSVTLAVAAAPRVAQACKWLPPQPFVVDPTRSSFDSSPPSPVSGLDVQVERIRGEHCSALSCSSDSCGDWAYVQLSFAPAQDDVDEPGHLGYRLVWLSGALPPSLREAATTTHSLRSPGDIFLRMGFNEVTGVDGELALVMVDRAGHESAMSEPVRVEYAGCTRYFDSDGCIESACSVRAVGAEHAGGVGALALFAVAAVAMRVRRARRS